jgi:hypothetical protein
VVQDGRGETGWSSLGEAERVVQHDQGETADPPLSRRDGWFSMVKTDRTFSPARSLPVAGLNGATAFVNKQALRTCWRENRAWRARLTLDPHRPSQFKITLLSASVGPDIELAYEPGPSLQVVDNSAELSHAHVA